MEAHATGDLTLTAEQLKWVAQRVDQPVRYCFNPDWSPFDFYKDGVHQGIFKDNLELFFRRLGLKGQAVVAPSWTAALEAVQRGDCELLAGAVKTQEREAFLAFTSPYYSMYNVLIAKPDKTFIGSLSSLEGETIAGPASGAIMNWIARDYPGVQLKLLRTGEETLDSLLKDEVYAVVSPLASFVSDYQWQVHNLKIIGKLDYSYPISVAVRRDQPELLGLMELAVHSLTEVDRGSINAKWQHFTVVEEVDHTKLLQLGGAALVALTVSLFWVLRLRREVARRRQVEAQLLHLASHDRLTGLLRSSAAMERIEVATARASRGQTMGALLFIDLDGFKEVNDELGHAAGDQVLVEVAKRMRDVLRKTDMLARVGGDEFVVCLEEVADARAAMLVANKLVQAVSQPIAWANVNASVGASVGVAMFPMHGDDAEALIKVADSAMYEAKRAGKCRVIMHGGGGVHGSVGGSDKCSDGQ